MAVTLEQVEKLRVRSGASYTECKQVLEQTDGDLLEAILRLEQQGRSKTSAAGGFFTTQPGAHGGAAQTAAGRAGVPVGGERGSATGADWRERAREVWGIIGDVLRHSGTNCLEVWRDNRLMTTVPVLALALLIIVAFWISIPLLLIAPFFGCHYRFSGPDLGKEKINRVMDTVSDSVDDMVSQMKHEMEKHKKK